ncbi:hypothetical protein SprV_0301197300 [Sparganum proliferum]
MLRLGTAAGPAAAASDVVDHHFHHPTATSAATAAKTTTSPTLTTGENTPDAQSTTIIHAASKVDSITTFPDCAHCFTPRIGLAGHLRIHRKATSEPVPFAPTYVHCPRIKCLDCRRISSHRRSLRGYMRIH